MRILATWIALFTAFLGFSQIALTKTLADRPGKVLIAQLIGLADSGRLQEADYVAVQLGRKFTRQSSTVEPFAGFCAPGYQKTPTTVIHYVASSGLQPTPYGRASITRPGFGIINSQPAEISGPSQITYYVSENHDCSGYVQSSNDVEANLDISPLSTYDCISREELLRWFPKIKRGYATDGAEVYYYESKKSNSNGSTLVFNSFFATECILGATLSQRSSDSWHYRAAKQKLEACMLPHEEQFCRIHPPFGWGDGDVQDEMAAFAVKQCGTLDKFLRSTPRNARPAERDLLPEETSESTPCSRVKSALNVK